MPGSSSSRSPATVRSSRSLTASTRCSLTGSDRCRNERSDGLQVTGRFPLGNLSVAHRFPGAQLGPARDDVVVDEQIAVPVARETRAGEPLGRLAKARREWLGLLVGVG